MSPLIKGYSDEAISRNIREMMASGKHSQAQSIAAAMSVARKYAPKDKKDKFRKKD